MAKQSVKDAPATLESVAVHDFGAAIDDKELKEMEKAAQDADHGITRRIALAVLTRDKAQLVDGFSKDEDSRNLLDTTCKRITDYITHLKAVTEAMEVAQVRLFCVAGSIVLHDERAAPAAGA